MSEPANDGWAERQLESSKRKGKVQSGGEVYYADGFEEDGKRMVKSGSCARHLSEGPFDDLRRLREEVIRRGVVFADPSRLYRFGRDMAFSLANAAAGVVNGEMASGPTRWVAQGRGTPLKELVVRFPGGRGCAASLDMGRVLGAKFLLDIIFETMYKSSSSLQGVSGVIRPGFVADYKA